MHLYQNMSRKIRLNIEGNNIFFMNFTMSKHNLVMLTLKEVRQTANTRR